MGFDSESNQAIEPSVSGDYLRDYPTYVPVIADIVERKPDKSNAVQISTSALEATPYKVIGYWVSGQATDPALFLRIVDENNLPVNGGEAGMNLFYVDKTARVSGAVFNRTVPERTAVVRSPIRNISGILAPLEDAFCQALANKCGSVITRDFETGQPENSRFVANYRLRGYRRVGDSTRTVKLEKHFPPENS